MASTTIFELETGASLLMDGLRNSSGRIFILVGDNLRYSSNNSPTQASDFTSISSDIPKSITLTGDNIFYLSIVSAMTSTIGFRIFNTSTNTFGTYTTIRNLGTSPGSFNHSCKAVRDSNGDIHVFFSDIFTSMGNSLWGVFYTNNIGGTFKTPIEVFSENSSSSRSPIYYLINGSLPEFNYKRSDNRNILYRGNQTNATSFTSHLYNTIDNRAETGYAAYSSDNSFGLKSTITTTADNFFINRKRTTDGINQFVNSSFVSSDNMLPGHVIKKDIYAYFASIRSGSLNIRRIQLADSTSSSIYATHSTGITNRVTHPFGQTTPFLIYNKEGENTVLQSSPSIDFYQNVEGIIIYDANAAPIYDVFITLSTSNSFASLTSFAILNAMLSLDSTSQITTVGNHILSAALTLSTINDILVEAGLSFNNSITLSADGTITLLDAVIFNRDITLSIGSTIDTSAYNELIGQLNLSIDALVNKQATLTLEEQITLTTLKELVAVYEELSNIYDEAITLNTSNILNAIGNLIADNNITLATIKELLSEKDLSIFEQTTLSINTVINAVSNIIIESNLTLSTIKDLLVNSNVSAFKTLSLDTSMLTSSLATMITNEEITLSTIKDILDIGSISSNKQITLNTNKTMNNLGSISFDKVLSLSTTHDFITTLNLLHNANIVLNSNSSIEATKNLLLNTTLSLDILGNIDANILIQLFESITLETNKSINVARLLEINAQVSLISESVLNQEKIGEYGSDIELISSVFSNFSTDGFAELLLDLIGSVTLGSTSKLESLSNAELNSDLQDLYTHTLNFVKELSLPISANNIFNTLLEYIQSLELNLTAQQEYNVTLSVTETLNLISTMTIDFEGTVTPSGPSEYNETITLLALLNITFGYDAFTTLKLINIAILKGINKIIG